MNIPSGDAAGTVPSPITAGTPNDTPSFPALVATPYPCSATARQPYWASADQPLQPSRAINASSAAQEPN